MSDLTRIATRRARIATLQARVLAERGLTTVEYAIGLLAAATAAMILIRIFKDNSFFEMLTKWLVETFKKAAELR